MSTENSILIKNIYYMLAYAYKALYREGFEKTVQKNLNIFIIYLLRFW